MNNCLDCKHCSREIESWEMPHIWWYECRAHPHYGYLKSFPFKRTKCASFVKAEPPSGARNRPSIVAELLSRR